MIRASFHRRVALVGAIVLSAFACRAADLASPSGPPASGSSSRSRLGETVVSRAPVLASCTARPLASASADFGPHGGVLRIGGSRLIIPAGALPQAVRISVAERGDASGTLDFQPEGLRFEQAATLVLDARGCDEPADAIPAVVHLGPDGEILETIDATFDRRRKKVAASIVHFSGYAIAF